MQNFINITAEEYDKLHRKIMRFTTFLGVV